MSLSHHIYQIYSNSRTPKAMRHQALSFLMEEEEAQRSMAAASLTLWDHTPVIIISISGNFQKALLTVPIRGTKHKHQALSALGRTW
ncbi:unnamed protein product [Prunus armeniaca]